MRTTHRTPFARLLSVALFITWSGAATAQVGTMEEPPDPQQPGAGTGSAQPGWAWFNDTIALSLKLGPEQLVQLRDMDTRYRPEYNALGSQPARSPKFSMLLEERNADVEDILTPEQFGQWNRLYNGGRAVSKRKH
jgi:hypothetical protein